MGKIIVNDLSIQKNKIICKLEVSNELNKIFREKEFWIEYFEDISNIGYDIAIIPLLANIAPIAWFTNSDIIIKSIDANFYDSLNELKSVFSEMYNTSFNSNIFLEKQVLNNYDGIYDATFFSGGIDSISTFISKKESIKYLVTLWGADIDISDIIGWEKASFELESFAEKNNLKNIFFKSNLRKFINEAELNNKFKYLIKNGWWPNVQHSLGMAGLLAPISYKYNIRYLFVPSSYTKDFNKPWGSDPRIDNKIKFCGLHCYHEGYELSRQNKIKNISKYINENDKNLFIRVCWEKDGGGNCCLCEKCCRTIVGLALEDINYKNNGFDTSKNFFKYVKFMLENSQWIFSDDEIFMWNDIRRNIDKRIYNYDDERRMFFEWLKSIDINKIYLNQNKFKNRVIRKLRKFKYK
ncbi:hypothetical protein [Clostridium perfringens]|uniref:hypothetical protein n=1 Tax=Clostridium perfringens TaxID=1502 RepID=UPI0013E37E7A|nr:hypothetical protein [Clostridium perfringens]NGU66468.1 hypothetical protein [Clostridium perfringens]